MDIHIPIISLKSYSNATETNLLRVAAQQIVEALAKTGFVYLSDLPISPQNVSDAFAAAQKFFTLPKTEKEKFILPCEPNAPHVGYIPDHGERFYTDRPIDRKEAFDYVGVRHVEELSSLPEDYHNVLKSMNRDLVDLSKFLLYLIGLGLEIEDPYHFVKAAENGDGIMHRHLYYPQIHTLSGIEPGQMRCQEHTDYGFITILFQDSSGGLEVKNSDGEYVEATPIPNTALINVGDMLAMCTSGKLKSTLHRVKITESNFQRNRQSMVLFTDPDGHYNITVVTGSDKTPGITCNDWRNKRFSETGLHKRK